MSKPQEVLQEEHKTLQTHYYTVEEAVMKVSVGLTDVGDMITKFKEKGEKVKLDIHKHFDELRTVLSEREQVLIATTDEIIKKKVSILTEQAMKLGSLHRDLETKQEKVLRILYRTDDLSYLCEKGKVIPEVLTALEKSREATLSPTVSTADGPKYFLSDCLLQSARHFGEVFCAPQPQKFTAHGDGLQKAFLKKEAAFVIEARDCYGHRSYVSGSKIDVTVQGSNCSIDTPYTIKEHEQGEYIVCYTPQQLGHHRIVIMANGKPIAQSDFTVIVFGHRDYFSLSCAQPMMCITKQQPSSAEVVPARHRQGQTLGDISTMRELCLLPGGNILFTDQLCLRVINSAGELIRTIGSFGNGNGQFKHPMGVAVNQQGQIFVSDSVNHHIQKFTNDGRFMMKFGEQGRKNGHFQCPAGLAVLGDEKLYVVDSGNNKIQVLLQKNGKCVNAFGQQGSALGQFNKPHDITIDSLHNRILVSDTENHRIQAFTLDGKPLMEFGSRNTGLLAPHYMCLAVDRDGFILSTDIKHSYVVIFSPQGFHVRKLGGLGNSPGKFRTPHGICVNGRGQIIVSDSSLRCLQVF